MNSETVTRFDSMAYLEVRTNKVENELLTFSFVWRIFEGCYFIQDKAKTTPNETEHHRPSWKLMFLQYFFTDLLKILLPQLRGAMQFYTRCQYLQVLFIPQNKWPSIYLLLNTAHKIHSDPRYSSVKRFSYCHEFWFSFRFQRNPYLWQFHCGLLAPIWQKKLVLRPNFRSIKLKCSSLSFQEFFLPF